MSCPKGKIAYDTLEDANRARSQLGIKNQRAGHKIPTTAYICPECGKWHVGRGPKGDDAEWNTRRRFAVGEGSMDPGPMSEGFGRRLRDPWGDGDN